MRAVRGFAGGVPRGLLEAAGGRAAGGCPKKTQNARGIVINARTVVFPRLGHIARCRADFTHASLAGEERWFRLGKWQVVGFGEDGGGNLLPGSFMQTTHWPSVKFIAIPPNTPPIQVEGARS